MKSMGININCKEVDFVELILNKQKFIETRNSRSLDPYIGKRVGIVKTGVGKATLVGYMTIRERIEYQTAGEFHGDYKYHRVPEGSKYDFKGKKYGYFITNVERCEPVVLTTKGIVARRIA